MTITINNNASASAALLALNATETQLSQTELAVTTGLKVNAAKDNPAAYAVAQNLKGQVSTLQSVELALNNGESAINTAVNAGQSVANLVGQIQAKVVQASQSGLDTTSKSALSYDVAGLLNQIDQLVANASFNGYNLIQSGASSMSVLSSADGSTITVSGVPMDVTDLGINSITLTNSANVATAMTAVANAVNMVAENLASLGSASNLLQTQNTFTSQLVSTLTAGIGTLVDANMADESAQLQALQVKQQLGVQALSIANQAPNAILSLFR